MELLSQGRNFSLASRDENILFYLYYRLNNQILVIFLIGAPFIGTPCILACITFRNSICVFFACKRLSQLATK